MTLPTQYKDFTLPVKLFLQSYRALSDGRTGIRLLKGMLEANTTPLSEWKVLWTGTCVTLRTAIDLFKRDAASCINKSIRDELTNEWKQIDKDRRDHAIFWEFLRKERDHIAHEYNWRAYEVWLHSDGNFRQSFSLLSIRSPEERAVLLMRDGQFKGRDSLELLSESADWVQERIYSAIRRAGYDPDEQRTYRTFEKPKPIEIEPSKLGLFGELGTDDN